MEEISTSNIEVGDGINDLSKFEELLEKDVDNNISNFFELGSPRSSAMSKEIRIIGISEEGRITGLLFYRR